MKFTEILCIFLFFACITNALDENSSQNLAPNTAQTSNIVSVLNITDELRAKHKLKPHHAKLHFGCIHCHENQGTDPTKFKNPGDEGCLSCHKSKKYIAKRTEFMDSLKANPHNSVHDGPNLYCDECHNEHKESINMCEECHKNEVKEWMRVTP